MSDERRNAVPSWGGKQASQLCDPEDRDDLLPAFLHELSAGFMAATGFPSSIATPEEWIPPQKWRLLTRWDFERSEVADDKAEFRYVGVRFFDPIPYQNGGGHHFDHASLQAGRLSPRDPASGIHETAESKDKATSVRSSLSPGRPPTLVIDDVLDQLMVKFLTGYRPKTAAALWQEIMKIANGDFTKGEDTSSVRQGFSNRFKRTHELIKSRRY